MVSEADTQNRIRIAIGAMDGRLWRNNSGVHNIYGKDGKVLRVIRYGLANDSKRDNEDYKSSDTIGYLRRIITQEDVGKMIAQFLAFEVKDPDWHITPSDKRAHAQWNFMSDVISNGGIASFITHPDQLEGLLNDIR